MSNPAAPLACVVPSPLLCCGCSLPGGMSAWRGDAVPARALSAGAARLASYLLPSERGAALDKLGPSDNRGAGMVALQTGRNQPQ